MLLFGCFLCFWIPAICRILRRMEAPAAVEEPAETAKPIEEAAEAPAFHSETVAVYPGDKNGLPYDVVVERLHVDRPEPTPPEPTPDTQPEDLPAIWEKKIMVTTKTENRYRSWPFPDLRSTGERKPSLPKH